MAKIIGGVTATNMGKAVQFDPYNNVKSVYGIVTLASPDFACGLKLTDGSLGLYPAGNAEIDARNGGASGYCRPITIQNLDYAVKAGITSNTTVLTDEEKANARNFIGAAAIDTLGDISEALDHIIALQESIMGGDS